ncbi:MAG: hypothetical protein ABIJ56_15805, partial [Pseudomonadota bacterium]
MSQRKSHTLLFLALAAGLLCGQCRGKKAQEDAGLPPGPAGPEARPGDTGEVLVDPGSPEVYELQGGISLQVLDLGAAGEGGGQAAGRTFRVKTDTTSQVPAE